MTPRQQSILIGAVVAGILSTSYLNLINGCCCLGIMIGGAVAVQQYTSRTGAPAEAGEGAIIGALAAVGGGVLSAILNRLLRPLNMDPQSIALQSQQWSAEMMEGMSEGGQDLSSIMEQFQGGSQGFGGSSVTGILVGLLFGLVINAIFGAIGGVLGTAMFGPSEEAA